MAGRKMMLNVRVDETVMARLDALVSRGSADGRRATKASLVSGAITAAYPDAEMEDDWPPRHQADWIADVDPTSNAELLDLADRTEERD